MRWAGHVACTGAGRGMQGFDGEALEETDFEKNLRRWEDDINMDLQETG